MDQLLDPFFDGFLRCNLDLKWDEDILKLLNIPHAILPEVKSNSEIYGYTKPYTYFGGEVPILLKLLSDVIAKQLHYKWDDLFFYPR